MAEQETLEVATEEQAGKASVYEMSGLETLAAIQAELRVPKNQNNDYGGYNYRTLEGINAALKPLLAKYVAAVTYSDEILEIGSFRYVQATCILHTLGGQFSAQALAREEEARKKMSPGQLTGSASSYARKYAAQGLFALEDCEPDDDSRSTTYSEPITYPDGRFNAHCQTCGRLGQNLSAQTVKTWACPDCGTINWGPAEAPYAKGNNQ